MARRLLGFAKPLYIICFLVNLLPLYVGAILHRLENNTSGRIFEILGGLLFGYLAFRTGRRKSLIFIGILFLVGEIVHFVTAMVFPISQIIRDLTNGFSISNEVITLGGAGIYIIFPMYIGEVAEDRNRGVLVLSFILTMELSNLFFRISWFLLGEHVQQVSIWTNVILLVIFLASSPWLPETPLYYLLNDKPEDARKALIRIRGSGKEMVEGELNELMLSVETPKSRKKKIAFRNLMADPAVQKAFCIGFVVLNSTQLYFGLMNSTSDFKEMKIDSDFTRVPHFVLYILKVLGIIIAVALIDRSGRKFLLLVSCASMAVTWVFRYFVSVVYRVGVESDDNPYVRDAMASVPITFEWVSIVIHHFGCEVVPWVLVSELFKTNVRVLGITYWYLMYCVEAWTYKIINDTVSSFGKLPDSNYLKTAVFVAPSVFFLIAVSVCLFAYNFLPETKGTSLEDISAALKNRKKGLIT